MRTICVLLAAALTSITVEQVSGQTQTSGRLPASDTSGRTGRSIILPRTGTVNPVTTDPARATISPSTGVTPGTAVNPAAIIPGTVTSPGTVPPSSIAAPGTISPGTNSSLPRLQSPATVFPFNKPATTTSPGTLTTSPGGATTAPGSGAIPSPGTTVPKP